MRLETIKRENPEKEDNKHQKTESAWGGFRRMGELRAVERRERGEQARNEFDDQNGEQPVDMNKKPHGLETGNEGCGG